MRKLFLLPYLLWIVFPGSVTALTQPTILITEVRTETANDASDEYIMLTNVSPQQVNLVGWKLEYYSATSDMSSPTRSILLSGFIDPLQSLYAGTPSAASSTPLTWTYAATLATAGGHIKIIGPDSEDLIGWGTAKHPETQAVSVGEKGSIYKRSKLVDGTFIDTNNNVSDFTLSVSSVPVQTTAQDVLAVTQTTTSLPDNRVQGVVISELFIDPVSPLIDATDEFLELHNTSNIPVNVQNLVVETGLKGSYAYTLPAIVIEAGGYHVFYADTTDLVLSNTEGRARLLQSDGTLLHETASYQKAIAGQSWSLLGTEWGWATPSPEEEAVQNTISAGTDADSSASSAAANATKTTKQRTSTKIAAKSSGGTDTLREQAYVAPPLDNQAMPVNPVILAGVGVFALGYMLYEYRIDIRNLIAKRRRFAKTRR